VVAGALVSPSVGVAAGWTLVDILILRKIKIVLVYIDYISNETTVAQN
jgi:hypothetical protein